jgi:hypothetical protein
MKQLALLALVVATGVQAECFIRSTSVAGAVRQIERITDINSVIIPRGEQKQCIVKFRVQVNGQWFNAEAEAVGPKNIDPNQLCARALDVGRAEFLTRVGPKQIQNEEQMVCTDQTPQRSRLTKVGDVVKESEVAPHPTHPYLFNYRNTFCKWFLETDAKGRDLVQYQGVICLVRKNEWQVIDKF